ncbi:MAG: ABC transporter permease subunit [Polyangiaceae bacterium]
MNPLLEVRLLASRELRKSFRSAKGLILAVLSVAGGAGVSVLLAWLDRMRREKLPPEVDARDLQQSVFTQIYDADTGKALADAPYSLWIMLIATLWLGPLLVALMGFDAVSGDLQHRTVRFWTVRTRRSSYLVGKFFGAWGVVLAVTLGMNAIVWGATATVGHLAPLYVVGWGLRFFAISIPISAAWCGIAILVGSQFKTPMLALLATCAVFFCLWFLRVVARVRGFAWLDEAYPNAYDRLLLSPHSTDVALGLIGPIGMALVAVVAAVWLFQKKDL